MAWKDNDLTRKEVFVGGLCLIVYVIVTFGCWTADYPSIARLDSETALTALHEEITDKKHTYLAVAGVLLLMLPMALTHTYYMQRLFETVLSFAFWDYYQWFYMFSMIIGSIIVCVLIPTVLVVVAYYSLVCVSISLYAAL